jgi:hypothetical protein
MRRKITTTATASLLALACSPAIAQAEPGLTVDPDSPAGVEYQIPLDNGRGHSGGSKGHPGGGSDQLFGSGITPAGTAGSGGTDGQGGGSGGGKDGKGSGNGGGAEGKGHAGSGSAGSEHGSPRRGSSAGIVAASAEYSTAGPIAGVLAAVLLAGAALGLFLRFRARSR